MDGINQLTEAFDRVSIVQLAHELGYTWLREGGAQKSPFRSEDKHAGSFSVMRSGFKDFANDEHAGGHIKFVMLARPSLSKKEAIELIIRAAGMEPERQSAGAVKAIQRDKREAVYHSHQQRVAELPRLGCEEPGPWGERVRDRWLDGKDLIVPDLGKLAASRGWPVEVLEGLVELDKTSAPLLPWSDEKANRRCWAFLVEKPIFKGDRAELVPVGFHGRYRVFKKDEPTEKRWVYCPYIPASERLSEFQQVLKKMKCRIPAYPFVLGDLNAPRLVIVLEGQFDVVSFALAMGWMGAGVPQGVVIMGLRGVSSPAVLLAAYGKWLRKHTPYVWIIPDNDKAGKQLFERKNFERIDSEPCFVDRLRAQGCVVYPQILEVPDCKDFNDIWRAHQPTRADVLKLAVVAGCGELMEQGGGE